MDEEKNTSFPALLESTIDAYSRHFPLIFEQISPFEKFLELDMGHEKQLPECSRSMPCTETVKQAYINTMNQKDSSSAAVEENLLTSDAKIDGRNIEEVRKEGSTAPTAERSSYQTKHDKKEPKQSSDDSSSLEKVVT